MSWLPTCSNCRPALNNARESAHKSPKCEDAAAIEGSVLLSSKVGIHNANFCPNSTMHINQRLWRWKKKHYYNFRQSSFCGGKLITTARSFLVKNGHLSHPFSWGRVEIHKSLLFKVTAAAFAHRKGSIMMLPRFSNNLNQSLLNKRLLTFSQKSG